MVGISDELDIGSEGQGRVFGFCWCNRKKPMPVPETGILQVWRRGRMGWVGQTELPVSHPMVPGERQSQ